MVAYEDNDHIIFRHYVVAIFWCHRMAFVLAYTDILSLRASRRSSARLRLRIFRELLFGYRRDDYIRPWYASGYNIIRHGAMLS